MQVLTNFVRFSVGGAAEAAKTVSSGSSQNSAAPAMAVAGTEIVNKAENKYFRLLNTAFKC